MSTARDYVSGANALSFLRDDRAKQMSAALAVSRASEDVFQRKATSGWSVSNNEIPSPCENRAGECQVYGTRLSPSTAVAT